MKKPRERFSMLDYLPWHQAIFARAIAAGEVPIDFLDGGTTYVNQSAPKQAKGEIDIQSMIALGVNSIKNNT